MSEDKKVNHEGWRKENSLTSPEDRDPQAKWRPDQSAPQLTNQEANDALEALNNDAFVKRFPQVERMYVDPPVEMQRIGLFSFIPAKGATPNNKGFYGWAKLRGNFATSMEANERAEYIIRNVDSYHQIFHTYVGRPFPLTVSSDYSKEVSRVDLRKDMTQDISSDVKSKRDKEQQDIEEIKKREDDLMKHNKKILADPENKEDRSDPTLALDEYITLRVKKAQVSWTYLETKKKLQEMVEIMAKTRHELEEMELKNPGHRQTYFQKYMDAREQAGLDTSSHQDNFIKFMVEDADIPEVDQEYEKMYSQK